MTGVPLGVRGIGAPKKSLLEMNQGPPEIRHNTMNEQEHLQLRHLLAWTAPSPGSERWVRVSVRTPVLKSGWVEFK